MYGNISSQRRSKFATVQAYELIGDKDGLVAGFFRLLFNAI